jgi:hypothetical protein
MDPARGRRPIRETAVAALKYGSLQPWNGLALNVMGQVGWTAPAELRHGRATRARIAVAVGE